MTVDATPMPSRDRPRRVLVLVQHLLVAGLERVVVDLANGLRPGWETTVCCFDQLGPMADALEPPNRAVLLRREPGFDRSFSRRLVGLARDLDVDLVHAHNRTAYVYAALATGRRRGHAVPLVYTEHGPTDPSGWRARLVMGWLARRRDRQFVAVADWIARTMVRDWRFPQARVRVVPNGVGAADEGPQPGLAAELGWSDDAPVVGIVAGLHPVKNHALLLRAWTRIRERHPRARLAIVGAGPERARLEALAAGLGLADAVRFVGQRVDARRMLLGFAVAVSCSRSEGMSITLLEAMAAARPIVATAVGGTPELLEHGRSALLVPSDDESALAAAIVALLEDPERAAALGDAARRAFAAGFSLDAMVVRYQAAYADALRAGRGA